MNRAERLRRKALREAADADSDYRKHARDVIQGVRDGLPDGATDADLKRALTKAYPFREKTGWAYTCWLRERRAALSGRSFPQRLAVLPDGVRCPHCSPLRAEDRPRGGCILCNPARAAFARLTPDDLDLWRSFRRQVAAGDMPEGALWDWLEMHDVRRDWL